MKRKPVQLYAGENVIEEFYSAIATGDVVNLDVFTFLSQMYSTSVQL